MNPFQRDEHGDDRDDDYERPTKIIVDLNVNHRGSDQDGAEQTAKLLGQINQIFRLLGNIKELQMTTAAEFQAGFTRIDTATTAIAERLRVLSGNIASGMTSAEEDAVKAQLDGLATTLEAMGVTPTDPVPVEIPPVDPVLTP